MQEYYTLWVAYNRALVSIIYPAKGRKPVGYDETPDDFVTFDNEIYYKFGIIPSYRPYAIKNKVLADDLLSKLKHKFPDALIQKT